MCECIYADDEVAEEVKPKMCRAKIAAKKLNYNLAPEQKSHFAPKQFYTFIFLIFNTLTYHNF